MNTRTETQTRLVLSSLWVFILLNMLVRDIHQLPTLVQELIDGLTVDQRLLLAAAFVLEIPILLVPLAHVLRRRAARVANIVGAGLWIPLLVGYNLSPDMDDVFFMAMQAAAAVVIIVVAVRWRDLDSAGTAHHISSSNAATVSR